MSDYDPFKQLGLRCPYGGLFYICSTDPVRFIGCCSINPCGARKGLCPDQHLNPASFDKARGGDIPPQGCVNDNVDVAWHNCPGTEPPFLGCCAVDPCSRGSCPRKELRAAKLSDKTKNAEEFLGNGSYYTPGLPNSGFDPVTSLNTGPTAALPTFITGFITSYTQQTTLGLVAPTLSPEDGGRGGSKHFNTAELALMIVFPILFVIVLVYAGHRYRRWKKARTIQNNTPEPRSVRSSITIDSDEATAPNYQSQETGFCTLPAPGYAMSLGNGSAYTYDGPETQRTLQVVNGPVVTSSSSSSERTVMVSIRNIIEWARKRTPERWSQGS
ncbi:hypothetical protein BKA59DRAFT_520091 [Fusarium tricinctum]|uniref:Uncharacterized protein n=1 Tax=Fusarium tricinctum TaxID=61284 RepID=A0A8K0WHN5_9HYPO|nr:hypothetical protein BKA59DRAFT_520091 [Fusarium tricinctum]